MTSIATSTWDLVFWERQGVMHAAVHGPETTASSAETAGDSESFGITFAHGTSMPHLPIGALVDGGRDSPHVTGRTFLLRDRGVADPRLRRRGVARGEARARRRSGP
ncbi:hypothetical protein ACFY4C_24040 [Actinomadura viridis]|uniref:hypothetical protein n=1 Tax=Actinomadura viridis TaxID=58110 RepID=UPI0036839878